MKKDYYLINSLSRSGGTYLNALFSRFEQVTAFPIEFPVSSIRPIGFLGNRELMDIKSVDQWMSAMELDDLLYKFQDNPYKRTMGRDRKDGDPEISFDLRGFRDDLEENFKKIKDIRELYETTFDRFFARTTVNGQPCPPTQDRLVNHFATNSTRSYSAINQKASESFNLYMLHIVRDPFESIISLKHHWWRVAGDKAFAKMAFARWRMNFYNILRNKLAHPDKVDIVVYHPDIEVIRKQFATSSLPLPRKIAGEELYPTVFGHRFFGQSYKEKKGQSVGRKYEYSDYFSQEEMDHIRSGLDELLEFAGIGSLLELHDCDSTRTSGAKALLDADPALLDKFSDSMSAAVDSTASIHINFRENVTRYFRSLRLKRGLEQLFRLMRKTMKQSGSKSA